MVANRDLQFLSRQFSDLEMPKEKKYLLKYFTTKIQQAFVRYVYVFGDYVNFVDHTGYYCQDRWLKILYNRLVQLELIHLKAKQNIDLTTLAIIESGNYNI